ncbi:MAG TPA: hypothetical protein VGF38_11575 [Ktedonobacterales bacterium]
METVVLKIVLTPALIGAASLAGRRWDSAVSGWLVGLPFTSGPVIFFLALTQGVTFASATATGTLAGTISQVAFALGYSWLAWRSGWRWALLGGSLAFAIITIALHSFVFTPLSIFLVVLVVLTGALLLMPRARSAKALSSSTSSALAALSPADLPAADVPGVPGVPGVPSVVPWWDLPARMAIATGIVLLLTSSAPLLGPQLTGLLSPFPTYAAILTVFAHRQRGPASGVHVLRGLLFGLYACAAFFLVVAVLLTHLGIALTFLCAIVCAVAVQAGSLSFLRRAFSDDPSAGNRS